MASGIHRIGSAARANPLIAASLLILLLFGTLFFVPLPAEIKRQLDGALTELGLLSILILNLAVSARRAISRNVRLFWMALAAAFSIWLGVRVVGFVWSELRTAQFEVLKDIFYTAHFCVLAAAVELRFDARRDKLWLQNRVAAAVGSVLLIIAIFGYFTLIPMTATLSDYASPFELHAALDAYIGLRLLYAASQASLRNWKLVYATLGVSFLLIVVADGLSWSHQNGVLLYEAGNSSNVIWYLWYPVALVASGFRLEEVPLAVGEDRNRTVNALVEPLFLLVVAMPFIHVIGYSFEMLEPIARSARDLFIACWIVVITILGFATIWSIRRRIRTLQDEADAAEMQARKLENQLHWEKQIRTIGQLSSGLAHDFGNTIAAISMNVKAIVKNSDRDTAVPTEIKGLSDGVEYAQQIIKNLKAFSSTTRQGTTTLIDIDEEIGKSIDILQASMKPAISLSYLCSAPVGKVRADTSMVNQVVTNFVFNAVDAVGDNGTIEVILNDERVDAACASCGRSVNGRFAVLSVKDSGKGVAPEIADQIFEPLVSSKPPGQGSGLGLSAVHGILHNIEGHVSVQSSGRQGTCFSAFFPIVD